MNFLMDFFLSSDDLRKTIDEFLHLLFLFWAWGDRNMNHSNGGNWRCTVNFLNTLNRPVVFVLVSWSFFNVVSELFMIGDTHVFLAFLVSLPVASFSFNISE